MRFTLISRILKILQYSLFLTILTPISCNRDHSQVTDANANSAETRVATKHHVRNSLQKSKLDMATIMEMAPGDARDDELFRLLVSDTDFIATFLVGRALDKDDESIARTLGKCLGKLGDDAWVDWLSEKLSGKLLSASRVGYVEGLAGTDIVVAIEFIKNSPSKEERDRLKAVVLLQLSKTDSFRLDDVISIYGNDFGNSDWLQQPIVLESMRNLLKNLNSTELGKTVFEEQFKALGNFSSRRLSAIIAEKDPKLALLWSLSLKDSAKENGITGVLEYQMTHQGDTAMLATIDEASKAIPRLNLMSTAVLLKCKENPESAAKWVQSLPSTAMNNRLYSDVTLFWYLQDESAVSSWASQLPPGEARDEAARTIVLKVMEKDLGSAIQWTTAIQDEKKRSIALMRIKAVQTHENILNFVNERGDSLGLSVSELNYLQSEQPNGIISGDN